MQIVSAVFDDNRKDSKLVCKEKTLTQQNLAAECDINAIIKKFEQSGLLTHVNEKQPQYGDFSEVADYQTALNTVKAAEEMFMEYPAYVREKFDNDPTKLIAFVMDPKNEQEGIKLGLLVAQDKKGGKSPEGDITPLESQDKGSTSDSIVTPAP